LTSAKTANLIYSDNVGQRSATRTRLESASTAADFAAGDFENAGFRGLSGFVLFLSRAFLDMYLPVYMRIVLKFQRCPNWLHRQARQFRCGLIFWQFLIPFHYFRSPVPPIPVLAAWPWPAR
jgi:hypothetical protein